jgi:mono/diheme cytochrome c family protein
MKENILAMMKNNFKIIAICLSALMIGSLSSCYHSNKSTGYEYAPNMYYPIAYNPDQANKQFANGQTAQKPVEGTIPVGWEKFHYENNLEGYTKASAELVNPLTIDTMTLAQGKVLYNNFCSHCHGANGKGDGAIIANGKFPPPPSYSTGASSRGGNMKDLTDGKIYHTITYGVNLMGAHASQISPEERWKIVAYVHELQKVQ